MGPVSVEELTGQSRGHLSDWSGTVAIHSGLIEPLRELTAKAETAGIELAVASGFRGFDRQLSIWNAKAAGQRPVMDSAGRPLDISMMPEADLMYAILRWSALPGTSRHHWGTDLDVWDKAAVPDNYRLQLVPEEYSAGGPFERLAAWLASSYVVGSAFFRPYSTDRGGVAPEPWHLSFEPLARRYQSLMTPEILANVISAADIALKQTILDHLEEIFARFVNL